jgi:hypothetical protein
VTVKGFKLCCISNAEDGIDDDMLRNCSEEDGNVKSTRKMKVLTAKMERVTLIDKGR